MKAKLLVTINTEGKLIKIPKIKLTTAIKIAKFFIKGNNQQKMEEFISNDELKLLLDSLGTFCDNCDPFVLMEIESGNDLIQISIV